MKQSEIEEIIDKSFERLIDTMLKFPENSYHINFEEIFFKGKADLIHRFEKIINEKDKQIDLMAKYISNLEIDEDICMKNIANTELCNEKYSNCKECIKQYFERKSKE